MSVPAAEANKPSKGNDPPEAVTALGRFPRRGAGTDSERRAALWLSQQLAGRSRDVVVEPFWCRPNWALAQAWHALLALAGSLVAVASPRVGGGMLLAALVCVIADSYTGISPGRRLTPERASQNVIGLPRRSGADQARLHLIITANYDAGRTGLMYRDAMRSAANGMRRALRGFTVGWAGWLLIDLLLLLAVAIIRLEGNTSTAIGAVQLVPTVALLLAVVLLVDAGVSAWSPAAADNGSGVAVVLSLARALSVSPPAQLDVEVVLTGAGAGDGIGLRRHLSARRKTHRPHNTVVIGIAPCADGELRWWNSDGPLLPARYGSRLVKLARQIAAEEPQLHARGHDGRGATPALPGRQARIPSLAVGCLDQRGLVPHSHQAEDLPALASRRAHDQAVQFGLILVDAVDAELREQAERSRAAG